MILKWRMKPVFVVSRRINSLTTVLCVIGLELTIKRASECKERRMYFKKQPFFPALVFFLRIFYFIWFCFCSLPKTKLSLKEIISWAQRITNNWIILALEIKEPLRSHSEECILWFLNLSTLSTLGVFCVSACDLTSPLDHDRDYHIHPIK